VKPSAAGVPALDDYEHAAALREALRRFARQSEDVTRRHGLTTRGYTLLLMIKTGREIDGGATPDELELRLQLAKSTIAELVQRAVDGGLVRRELHPSRRGAIRVRLTPKGGRRLERAFAELQGEREHLRELLEAINRPQQRVRAT
jgi:DNA-binding MarR family transcriptional regulator